MPADITTLPKYEEWAFGRWLAKTVEAYFENPDVKRRFEEWKREEERRNGNG